MRMPRATKRRQLKHLDPSRLPGTHHSRVFVGGSYVRTETSVLDYFGEVRAAGHMETLAYAVRRATGDPDVERWCVQNARKVAAFKSWSERWAVHRSEVAERPRENPRAESR